MPLPDCPAGQARGPTTPRPGHVWQRSPARPLAGLPGIFVVVAVTMWNDGFKCDADTDSTLPPFNAFNTISDLQLETAKMSL